MSGRALTVLINGICRNKVVRIQPHENLDAFEGFFHQHHAVVFGYLWRMTGEEQIANDLSQETFLRAWQQFPTISTYDQPRAWLFRVATHLALDHAHSMARRSAIWHRDIPIDEDSATMLAPDQAEQVVKRDSISRQLLALPPRERSALVLHAVYGLSCAELADVLHISLSAAKVAVWRGRERFRRGYLHEEADR